MITIDQLSSYLRGHLRFYVDQDQEVIIVRWQGITAEIKVVNDGFGVVFSVYDLLNLREAVDPAAVFEHITILNGRLRVGAFSVDPRSGAVHLRHHVVVAEGSMSEGQFHYCNRGMLRIGRGCGAELRRVAYLGEAGLTGAQTRRVWRQRGAPRAQDPIRIPLTEPPAAMRDFFNSTEPEPELDDESGRDTAIESQEADPSEPACDDVDIDSAPEPDDSPEASEGE